MNVEKRPLISVIIPTYHDWKRLQLCLDALDQQSFSKDLFYIIYKNYPCAYIQLSSCAIIKFTLFLLMNSIYSSGGTLSVIR